MSLTRVGIGLVLSNYGSACSCLIMIKRSATGVYSRLVLRRQNELLSENYLASKVTRLCKGIHE